jgi:hypothetical protein
MVGMRGAGRACNKLRLWRDTALATMAHELVACFDLLSHVVEDGGVLCRVRLFLF